MEVNQLLLDLIAIPSVSSLANQPVIDYATRHLDPTHWNLRHFPHKDPAGTTKINLVALTKNAQDNHAELALVCHTDTVPFDPAWPEALHPKLANGRLYGRGSCDVKGFLACILAAVHRIDIPALRKPLAIVLTADEEVGCIGAKHLAAHRAFSTRYMLIGEPTQLRPVRAGKGYALGTVTIRGKEAHSAFPAAGRSAIHDAARVIFCLESLAAQLAQDHIDRTFDPPFTTLNIGLIEGGTAKNIVPGECRLTVEWRPIPGQRPEFVADLIEELLAKLAATPPGIHATFTTLRADPPFNPAPTTHLADLLTALSGNAPTTIAFGSEAAHLRDLATETLVFGAGDMTTAHKTGEFVPEDELHRCVDYLQEVVTRTCG